MKASLQTASAIILAFTTLSYVSAVEYVHSYVTDMITVTGNPPVSTAVSTLITSTVTAGAPVQAQGNAPVNAQVNAPDKLAVQPVPVAVSSSSSTSSTSVSSTTSTPPPAPSPESQVNAPEKLAVNPVPGAGAGQSHSFSPVQSSPAVTTPAVPHTPKPSAVLSSESVAGNTQSTATVPASAVTSAPVLGNGVMTIKIKNNWPQPLSISYGDNEGSPNALGTPAEAPLAKETSVVYPTGWAGRIYVGEINDPGNSKIEGSTTGWNDIDVSYVDGYSVPITCSNDEEPITGCNIDLWSVSGECSHKVGDNNVCLNPMVSIPDGPSTPWFLPCQGAAYTFPNDNVANNGNTHTDTVTCCIGTKEMGCEAPERQGKGNNQASKRSLPEKPLAFKDAVEEARAHSPHEAAHTHSHLKRHLHHRRSQGHAIPRGLKDVV